MRTMIPSSGGLGSPPSGHHEGCVLVVDDDAEISLLLSMLLKQQGLEVAAALTVRQAKELVQRRMPIAITLDLNLPDESGESFATWLRQHRGVDVPIIVISAATNMLQIARRVNAVAALAKPFEVDELIWALDVALKRVQH